VPALIVALKDQNPIIRSAATDALRRIGAKAAAAVPALIETLDDKDWEVRRNAALALGAFGPAASGSIPALIEGLRGLKHGDDLVRALRQIGKVAVPALMSALNDPDHMVKRQAAQALWGTDVVALPALLKALKDSDGQVRSGAAFAIGGIRGIGSESVQALIEALRDQDSRVRRGAAFSLVGIGHLGNTAIPALTEALKDEDGDVRSSAARAIGALSPASSVAVPALIDALKDRSDADLRENVTDALIRLGPDAVPQLIKTLEDQDHPACRDAAEIIEKIGPAARPGLPGLIKALKHEDASVRSRASVALKGIGPEAIPEVIGLLKDPDPGVRQDVEHLLLSIDRELGTLESKLKDALRRVNRPPYHERSVPYFTAPPVTTLGAQPRKDLEPELKRRLYLTVEWHNQIRRAIDDSKSETGLENMPPAGAETRQIQYKRINAWIARREGEANEPLTLRWTYILKFSVGRAIAESLIKTADANILVSDIPEQGLDTDWVIVSSTVMLETAPHDPEVKAAEQSPDTWRAQFSLHVPKSGESEIRQLRITPLTMEHPEIQIVIFARGSLYRQFKIELSVVDPGRDQAPGGESRAVNVTAEVIHAPGTHTGIDPPHEWQTPDGEVNIVVVGGGKAYAGGKTPLGPLSTMFDWKGAQALIDPPIRNLRDSADKFREDFSDELNDVDPQDLSRRLTTLKHSHANFLQENLADAPHNQVWDQKIAGSAQLYDVAYYGYQLYQTLFPDDDPGTLIVRKALDSLPPGWRVTISWSAQTDSSWVPNVPWGLLYSVLPVNGQPVTPLNFWGLRYRINYLAHSIKDLRRPTLGVVAQTPKGYGLYWGVEKEIAEEAARQQKEWASWANQKFVPDSSLTTTSPKDQLLSLLNSLGPQPMPVLYLFCQCDVGDGSKPVLRFGNSKQPPDNVRQTDISLTKLRDQPLVFVNACTSAGSDPYVANQLEQTFFARGCRAYLGTEIKVPIRLASRFASIFYHFFYREIDDDPIAAGEAVYQTRRFLWREYRNIGGLFYTYINQYDLFMAGDTEVP